MKEFEPLSIFPDQELRIQIKQKQEYKLIGSFKIWRGMKLYSVNLKTLEVKDEKISRQAIIDVTQDVIYRSRVNYNPDCKYLLALNEENAIRKSVMILKKIYSL